MKSFKLPLKVDHQGMSVPYLRRGDPNSHDYIDLKANPEQIDLLPEVKDWPELKTALQTINGFSGLRTLGCAHWLSPELDEQKRTFVSSYIQFCFDKLRTDVRVNYSLYHLLSGQLFQATLSDDLRIEMEIRRTAFNGDGMTLGWSVDYNVWGRGFTHDDGR